MKKAKWSGVVGASVLFFHVATVQAEDCKKVREQGFRHFDKGEYVPAIDAFRKCMDTEPTAGSMAQMASAFNAVGRYDEALRWYEKVLADFPNASADTKKKVQAEIKDLLFKVGSIAVEGDVVTGARLWIDKREVGELPLQHPVRVAPGKHEVRADKPGFPPIVATVDVVSGKTTVAKLEATERVAKLDVREKHNWILHVEIDGVDKGETPWSGLVPVGKHRLRLRGFMEPTALEACETPDNVAHAGTRMESEEKELTLYLYETQSVELAAFDKDTSLRIESVPPLATLTIDGQEMGKTAWEGRLDLGEHTIELKTPGFVPEKQFVTLLPRKQSELRIRLNKIPEPSGNRAARNATMAVGYGIGGIGLGLWGITGGWALALSNDLNATCAGGTCPGKRNEDLSFARSLSGVANAGLILAGSGLVMGTISFFLPDSTKKSAPSTSGHFRIGADGVTFTGLF